MKNKFNMITSEKWSIVVARSIKEIENIRPIWEQMQQDESLPILNVDIEHYLANVESMGESVQPHIIVLYYNNTPKAMVIGRIERNKIPCKLGYKKVLNPSMLCFSVVYGGFLGQRSDEVSTVLLRELLDTLKRGEADVAYLNHMHVNTPEYNLAVTVPNLLCRDYFPQVENHWQMSVPDNIDDFYAGCSRKHRGNLRRYIRKIDELNSDGESIIQFVKEEEVEDFLKTAEKISAHTYQGALGAGIVNDEKTRILMRNAAGNGWFHGAILLAGNEPCAFQLGFRYKKIYYLLNIGFDHNFNKYNPGTVLFLKVLDSLCKDDSIDTIDFYFGDAEYKEKYGTDYWPEAVLYIFAPRLRPILINLLRNSVTGANSGLVYLAQKIHSVNWVKRWWRNRLQEQN